MTNEATSLWQRFQNNDFMHVRYSYDGDMHSQPLKQRPAQQNMHFMDPMHV